MTILKPSALQFHVRFPQSFRPRAPSFLYAHPIDLNAVLTDKGGWADGISMIDNSVRMVDRAHMIELNGSYRTMGFDRLGQGHDALHMYCGHIFRPNIEAMLMAGGILVVDKGLGDGDLGKPAAGFRLIGRQCPPLSGIRAPRYGFVVIGEAKTRFLNVTPLMVYGENIFGKSFAGHFCLLIPG